MPISLYSAYVYEATFGNAGMDLFLRCRFARPSRTETCQEAEAGSHVHVDIILLFSVRLDERLYFEFRYRS